MNHNERRARALHILKENEEFIRQLVEEETRKIRSTSITATSEFDITRQYYRNEGIIEGLRRFVQRLHDWASRSDGDTL